MTNIPELTDDEATVLRQMLLSSSDFVRAHQSATSRVLLEDDSARAALAAYDAKKRAAIEAPLREQIAALQSVIDQHDLCHDLHGKVSAEDFARGCAAEQRRLYGCAPHADALAKATEQDAKRCSEVASEAMATHFRIHAFDEWHEEDGAVLWFTLPIEEPPWCGTPNDDDWPWVWTEKEDTCWCKLPSFFTRLPEAGD